MVGLGVLADLGTPRDPKSHLFVTKWVAIQPFCMILRPAGAEFRPGARQIGPTPSVSTFFRPFFYPKMPKSPKSGHVFERIGTSPGGLGNSSPRGVPSGPKGAPGAQGGPRGPPRPQNRPKGPRGAQGGPGAPPGARPPLTPGAAGWPLRAYYTSYVVQPRPAMSLALRCSSSYLM